MKINKSWGKKILFPGLLLSVAAMGILFLLQIRWMNNSLWSENMRYRREAVESVNRIARFTLDSLNFHSLTDSDPFASLEDWRLHSSYPFLVKEILLWDEDDADLFAAGSLTKDIILFSRSQKVAYILDGAIFYESILLGNLKEYAGDYTFSLNYKEETISEPRDKKIDWDSRSRESVFTFYLPRFIDLNDKRSFDFLLNPGPDRAPDGNRVDPAPFLYPLLTIDLNDSRGSESFILRLRRFNMGLIISLSLVLLGSFTLLYRLFREEEKQRRAEQTFVASVSHELRTPIAVIKSASDNLSRGVVTGAEKVLSYGSVIGKEADRLNRMVESILYYSRLEGGEGVSIPQWEETNLQEFTREILSSLELAYPDRTLEKELTGVPEKVSLDREAYRLIVENLVLNGLIHGKKSPVRVRLVSDYPFLWRLVVEDDGPGIPKREQKEIFEPFVRGTLSMADQIKGSGLGLHLVNMAACGMGGSIKLESPYEFPAGIERKGCRFQLILPVKGELNS
jgi:signal transduction histidine kinase